MNDPVIKQAIRLRDRLLDVARQYDFRRPKSDTEKELDQLDQRTCQDAADMLQKLGTEVTRLRLGIQHYQHGRLTAVELWRFPDRWNGD